MKNLIKIISLGSVFTFVSACNHTDDKTSQFSQLITESPKVSLASSIHQYIESSNGVLFCNESVACKNKNLAKVYESIAYVPVWMADDGKIKQDEIKSILVVLDNSYQDGLNPQKYNTSMIRQLLQTVVNNNASNFESHLMLELSVSDAYLSYANDIQNGVINPVRSYPDWRVDRTMVDVAGQFESSAKGGLLVSNLQNMAPNNKQYIGLKNKLAEYNDIAKKSGESVLSTAALAKMKQIALNMDRLRWLPHNLAESYIWVNIPQYQLNIYTDDGESNTFNSPVIVGQSGQNKTCLVTSNISNIEFNPYWGVPKRIATDEYLHKLQKDPYYLSDRGFRIFGKNNKEIDPDDVDWESVNAKNFKYFFRQDPGTKNALGKLKFIFSNSCGIYLHDTANRGLFSRDSRSMSHGCVRVGKPIPLAKYLLVERDQNSVARIDKLIKESDHAGLRLKNPMPLYIVYQTAVINDDGNLITYKDIYGIDNVKFNISLPLVESGV